MAPQHTICWILESVIFAVLPLATVRSLGAWLITRIHQYAFKAVQLLRFADARQDCAPLPGETEISAKWVATQLRKHGVIGSHTSVDSVELLSLDGNRGLAGSMNRLKVSLSGANGASLTHIQLILKRSHAEDAYRLSACAAGHNREAQFYAHPISSAMPKPAVYYGYGSRLLGEYVILMEDLTYGHVSRPMNMLFGNQIWGSTVTLSAEEQSKMLVQVGQVAARIHARHWRDASLFKLTWLKGAQWYKGYGRVEWEMAIERVRQAWAFTKESRLKSANKPNGLVLDPMLTRIIEASLAQTSWEYMMQHLANPCIPWTLCHGDFHASNMMLVKDNASSTESIVLFDWSEVGPWEPTGDLGQMIISDVRPEVFRTATQPMLQAYWEELKKQGVNDPNWTWEACWDSFCRSGVEKWMVLFILIASFPTVPDSLVEYFASQMMEFIKAHNPRDAYPLKNCILLL